MPKLIMIGSNDPYWSTDAVSLYWDELPEPKWLLDVPGAGHSLNDPRRVLGTAAAFLAAVATNTSLPLVNWKYEVRNGGIELVMESDRPCVAAGLWVAEAARLDFRNATWTRTESTHMGTAAFTESAHVEPGRCVATFGEMKFENAGDPPFFLSSPVRTLDRPAC
jgi:PhoPQ-activated pathogenicity-related protein